jgi:hypothetical protein
VSGDTYDWLLSKNVGSDISLHEARLPQYLRKSFPTISPELGSGQHLCGKICEQEVLTVPSSLFPSNQDYNHSYLNRRINHIHQTSRSEQRYHNKKLHFHLTQCRLKQEHQMSRKLSAMAISSATPSHIQCRLCYIKQSTITWDLTGRKYL